MRSALEVKTNSHVIDASQPHYYTINEVGYTDSSKHVSSMVTQDSFFKVDTLKRMNGKMMMKVGMVLLMKMNIIQMKN